MLVLALLLGGCSQIGGNPAFERTLPAQPNHAPLPFRLIDHSGTITGVQVPPHLPDQAANQFANDVALAVPGDPNAVFIVWLGGLCDDQVAVEYTGGDSTFTVTTTPGDGDCPLVGVPRSVIVRFASPVDVAAFTVQQL